MLNIGGDCGVIIAVLKAINVDAPPVHYARVRAVGFNVPYPFRRQEVHSFGDLIAEHNELVRRQRTRPVRVRVVVDAARIPQHALEFAQLRVLHDDEQGLCNNVTKHWLIRRYLLHGQIVV